MSHVLFLLYIHEKFSLIGKNCVWVAFQLNETFFHSDSFFLPMNMKY